MSWFGHNNLRKKNTSSRHNNRQHSQQPAITWISPSSSNQKGEASNPNEQQESKTIPNLPNVKNVSACLNEQNPVREVIVKWEKPAVIGNFKYEVCLENESQKRNKAEPVNGDELEKCFTNLMSDTKYTAYVSIIQNGKKSERTSSNTVLTEKAFRIPGFDIKMAGRPEIKICSCVSKDDEPISQFGWELPDLGEEKNNFKLLWVQAFVAEEKEQREAMVVEENVRATPKVLKFLKNYTFTARCTYLDLDNDATFHAESTAYCDTGIGAPALLDVTCQEKNIMVDWIGARGATRHVLKVIDKNNEAVEEIDLKEEKKGKEVIQMSYRCGYGRTCKFVIEATAPEIEVKTASKTFLIGGGKSVADVVLTKDPHSPRRQLIARWKPPVTRPQGYIIKLHEVKKDKVCPSVDDIRIEHTQLSYKFIELKSSTAYMCEVRPRYDNVASHGAFSNQEKTEKRVTPTFESKEDFGMPELIKHNEVNDAANNLVVELAWNQIQIGENYKIKSYIVEVFQPGIMSFMSNTVLFKSELPAATSKVDIGKLKRGQKYDVTFITKCRDLDKPDKPNNFTKKYSFCTYPSKTQIKECQVGEGVIVFSWEPVEGAKHYRLIIKDELLSKNVAQDELITGKESKVKVQMSDELRIGKTCMTKVITDANDLTSETEWKAHLIGGESVPRNVHATKNIHNSKRSIRVTFDAPKQGPGDKYKILVLPERGKIKTVLTSTNNVLIEYLRKGIRYKFVVFAKHAQKWSAGAESIPVQTDGGKEDNPVFNIIDSNQSLFNMQSAQFTGNTTTVNVHKGEEFGKVRDLAPIPLLHEKHDKDIIELNWKVPSFDNKASDYKVEKYKVEIKKSNSKFKEFYVEFEKNLHVYKTNKVELNLGETYEILVSTIYIDIDGDEEYMSSAAKETVQTKPSKPSGIKCKDIKNDVGDDALKIEWNSAGGAVSYEVKIYTEYSDTPDCLQFQHDVGKKTEWIRTFDDEFGFGTSYYAVITAIGSGKKTNSKQTDRQTIGGNFAPRKVRATIDHKEVIDPNTQMYLSWEKPAQQPESYEITSENAKALGVMKCNETSKLITGLKAGVFYTFKVVAIHKVHKKRSGGCVSNRVQTNPTPTQVKDVQTRPGTNPSTSIRISWSKVDAEKKDESTKYLVVVATSDEKIRNEINVTAEQQVIIEGLLPGTKYSTTVSGGNSSGFGKPSEEKIFETELGTPKDVRLLNNRTAADTSLILQFSEAEGKPKSYFGNLVKHENRGRYEETDSIKVHPGYVFNNLESNTKYIAVVYAVFADDVKGKAEESKFAVTTAPSKSEIYAYGRCDEKEVNNSKDLFLKWKSDVNCGEHEILIKHLDKVECRQIIENENSLIYSCQHEASRYSAQIRTKNDIFGAWSDEVMVDLAPAKLKSVKAEMEEKGGIVIQFRKATTGCCKYFCQALCNDAVVGDPFEAKSDDKENVVGIMFKPEQPAEKYSFKLWAEDGKGVMGEYTLSNYVISKPAKGQITKVEKAEDSPSTDIEISWESLERCDEYQIKIERNGQQKTESIVRSTERNCTYRCQFPGNSYNVQVRGTREAIHGEWSEKTLVNLSPAEVELIEGRDEQVPVETVHVKWKELEPKPEGYHVILYQKGEKVADEKTDAIEYNFKSANPGSLCYCTVAAYNSAGEGKAVKTQNYRIKWNNPGFLLITADENDPSRRAKITWEKPESVNCFRLEIENNQTESVIAPELEKNSFIFESGIPGNSYAIRLYSGCDGHYSSNYLTKTMIMKPAPPTKINAVAYKRGNGILVTFEDNSALQNSYEVCAKRVTKEGEEYETVKDTTDYEKVLLKNLIPGESYEIGVTTLFRNERSKKIILKEYVQTYPEVIQNLQVKEQNGIIIFTWDPLRFKPDKYAVQWRVNNDVVTDDSTNETKFEIHFLEPAKSYKLRVMASNSAGDGEMTAWKTYITDPLPPYNLKVISDERSPKTSFIVKYEDKENVNKSYRVSAVAVENGRDVEKVSVVTQEFITCINGLNPGRSYFFKVQTIFCGKKSKELFYTEH